MSGRSKRGSLPRTWRGTIRWSAWFASFRVSESFRGRLLCNSLRKAGFFVTITTVMYAKSAAIFMLMVFSFQTFFLMIARAQGQDDEPVNIHNLLSDQELRNSSSMSFSELETFLQRGALGTLQFPDTQGNIHSAAEIIFDTALAFELNPRFLLVMLQREQSLIEDPSPSLDQLDWAMGYGVCDDCAKNDPGIQKFRGFAKQVYYASERIAKNYLPDLERTGRALSSVGQGFVSIIDGRMIIPQNHATAVLYTYTPHLLGNQNFVRIWRHWFSLEYPDGSLLQNTEDGGVWHLKNGLRRPITSRAALFSRFGSQPLLPIPPSLLQKYRVGSPIRLPNYALIRTPDGVIGLLVDETLRPIPSLDVFRAIGFNPDEIVDVPFEDVAGYVRAFPLASETLDPRGTLVQNNKSGAVFWMENGVRHPIVSREVLRVMFADAAINPMDPESLAFFPLSEPVRFRDGTLLKQKESADIFVISEGKRRPIKNGNMFETFGWKWSDVIETDARSVDLHPLSDPL